MSCIQLPLIGLRNQLVGTYLRVLAHELLSMDSLLSRSYSLYAKKISDKNLNQSRVFPVDLDSLRHCSDAPTSQVRRAGARRVYLASASPPVRHPNVYGVDMPTRKEFVACDLTEDEIRSVLGADGLLYQSLEDLLGAASELNPKIGRFEDSCFSGQPSVTHWHRSSPCVELLPTQEQKSMLQMD